MIPLRITNTQLAMIVQAILAAEIARQAQEAKVSNLFDHEAEQAAMCRRAAQAEPGDDDRAEYGFDVTMIATIRLRAASEAEAREMMADALDCCEFNFGAWPDGSPIVGGASIQDDGTLIEVNGEAK